MKFFKDIKKRIRFINIPIATIFIIWFLFFSLPNSLFNAPKSLVIYDKNQELLYAKVATDEQWRFPKIDSVSDKVEESVLLFEDAYFHYHIGINPLSLIKSFFINIKSNDIRRGGSTITMQTIRLLQNNPSRTYWEKIKEIILSIRFELQYSKNDILKYYVSNAPYGGNIVGIEAAAWRYYNKSSFDLTWAEAATLAVLPNQPSYIYPGKNQKLLLKKRNRLLKKLFQHDKINETDYILACEEPLPKSVYRIPALTYHLAEELRNQYGNGVIHSTIQLPIQRKISEIINGYYSIYKQNLIYNTAALVIDANTSEVLAYVGNVSDTVSGNKINMITKPRSSGSTLKPFLYAEMLDEGLITKTSLLQDIPMDINGYEPQNFSYHFDGLVPANQALVRSLNIPWILSLKKYGYDRFYDKLQTYGFEHFNKSSRHYGLSLVVGGGEVTLWELANSFLKLSHKLKGNNSSEMASFIIGKKMKSTNEIQLSKAAIWQTFQTLSNVIRPENEDNWQYRQSQKLAWKTGTSHGFRDAWAVGVNPNYVIAVWVGNAEGNGRAGLTGIKKAAPILFDILNSLPVKKNTWYPKPIGDMKQITICQKSGNLPNENCDDLVDIEYPEHADLKEKCSYHTKIYLDSTGMYQVNKSCMPEDKIQEKIVFKLPIVEENYYKIINPLYQPSLPIHPACIKNSDQVWIDMVFPKQNSKITVSTSDFSNKIIFQAIHRIDSATLFWFIDKEMISSTKNEHKILVLPSKGWHKLTVQDNLGNFITRRFYIENRR